MKYTVIFIAICLVFISPVYAEAEQLYLVYGEPKQYPVILFKADEKKKEMNKVRTVDEPIITYGSAGYSEAAYGINLVRPVYSNYFIYSLRITIDENDKNYVLSEFNFINMDKPLELNSMVLRYESEFSHLYTFTIGSIDNPILLCVLYSKDYGTQLKGISLKSGKVVNMPKESYSKLITYGISGSLTAGGDYQSIRVDENNIPFAQYTKIGEFEKVKLNWTLPKSIKFKKNDRIVIYVNNSDILVLASIKSRVKGKSGNTPFHILDKSTDKWHTVVFPGGKTGVRGFDNAWVAGTVHDEKVKRNSPGREKRKPNIRKTDLLIEDRFDDRAKSWNVYSPGELFLYNAKTRKRHTIKTGQGDSEILHVVNDTVYYRVFDEIYKAVIGKNKLGKAILVVKGDDVPHIHWAFIGPEK